MPFNYEEYQQKCNGLSTEQLQKEWENYTRQIAGGATSTATSVLFSPLTAGISLVGLGLSAPRIHNARKKREIIEKGLQDRGSTHNTRSRDVAGSMALSGAISVATLGLAGPLADAAAGEAVGKGVEYAAAHIALDGAGAAIEHVHDGHLKKKGEQELKMKAMQAQLAQLQGGQQVMVNGQNMQMQQQYYQGVQMGGFQQPGLTPGLALPPAGILMQNQQQIQWQQQPGLQIPGMQQPQMQIPGLQPGVMPPMRPHSAAPDNQYGQYAVANQQMQPQQQFTQQQLPQYQQVQQQDEKYHLHVVPNGQQQQQQQQQNTYPSEKTPAYTTGYMQGDANVTPLPLYSQEPAQHERALHPNHIDIPAAPTMEEEIAFLKAKLLQMELEKRGMSATISGPLEISLDGGPKAKEAEQQQQAALPAQEVSATGQTPPQQHENNEHPHLHVETHIEPQVTATPQRRDTLSAPSVSNDRVASPSIQQSQFVPPVQSQPQHEQNAPVQTQQVQEPQYAQVAIPNPQTQQQYAPQPSPQQVQSHQRQNSLASPSINHQPVSPAPQQQQQQQYQTQTPAPQVQSQYQAPTPPPQQQNYTPAPLQQQQQQQQQTPIYQPQPVNPQLQTQKPVQQQPQYAPVQVSSPQQQPQYAPIQVSSPQQQPQYAPIQVSSPQQHPQPQYQQQQVYQQNQANCPPVQRQDSGYFSQASTPLSRPVSSISSISSISSPVGRHASIPSYSPHQQVQQQYQPQARQQIYQQQAPQQNYQPQAPQQNYQPQQQQYNPQNHGRSQSVAAPPPPYFAPPPSGPQPVLAGKDYFNQGQQQQHPSFPNYGQAGHRGSVVGVPGQQGWQQQQWGGQGQMMNGQMGQQQRVAGGGEPNYGPPPPVPGVWRG